MTTIKLGFMILILAPLCGPSLAQSTNGLLTVQIGTGGTPPLALVNHGEVWRYRKGTSAPPAGWQTNADATLDSSWLSGPGGFGYGDAAILGEATTLNDMLNGYSTFYIRRSFEILSEVATNRLLQMSIDFDDGYVAYLDGAELSRSNAPGGLGTLVPYDSNATTGREASCCNAPVNPPGVLDLGPVGDRLFIGTHVLAIQGLNVTNSSSDFHLIADLSVAGDSAQVAGVFFSRVNTNSVLLAGSNTVSSSTRVLVNGEEAAFNTAQGTWSKTQALSPGFNRLTIQALDAAGAELVSTNKDIVVELASRSVGGALAGNTVWDPSMGILRVTNSVVLADGGTLSIEPGTLLLFESGASILATNASITVSGTATNPVYFLPADGTTVWGGLVAAGTNGNLTVRHAETIAGYVQALDGATGLVEDCYLRDYTLNTPPIVHALRASSMTLRRNHVQRYYEHLIQLTPVVMEDCLVENITGDGIDFDGAPPGSVIRRCTIRHGDLTNVDGLDMGNYTDGTPSRGVVIEDCLIYDFTFDKGVSIGEAAQDITVRRCVIYQVQSGVAVKDSSVATIYNNTIVDSEFGLHLYEKNAGQGGGHATAYNNIIWGVGTNAVLDGLSTVTITYSDLSGAGPYPGTGNLNADPLFVNPATRDYHLFPNSPCIDTGDPASPREPDGTRADMGAFPSVASTRPSITSQPVSQTVPPGTTVTFSVRATGTPPLRYQWRAGWVPGDIPGATNDTLIVSNAQANVAGNYRVIVSNAVGSTPSDMVVLRVVQPPAIIGAGISATNTAGFSFTSVTNVNYVVEYTDTLSNPAWLTLRALNGDGGTLTISDTWTNRASRFYRIRVP